MHCAMHVASQSLTQRSTSSAPPGTAPAPLPVSIGIQRTGPLFDLLPGYESQHIPINGGPASKGFNCLRAWLGNSTRTWDLITFNFGLHSLDNPPTSETENITTYAKELQYIASTLSARSRRVLWVDTTPVPENVTIGPKRHNADVRRYNQAAATVMRAANISTCSLYEAVFSHCNATTGPPDETYVQCPLQIPGGVHFETQGWEVLADKMALCITGRPAPPPPPPMTCPQAEDKYCPGLANKGSQCCSCVAANRKSFEAAGCFPPNTKGAAVRFCRQWCGGTAQSTGDPRQMEGFFAP